MKATLLGCGPSWGVPAIGPDWGRCDPAEPRNTRRRCSLLIESRGAALLIDTSPDLRQQLLDAGAARLDAVLLTHAHADHLHGIDDLRIVNKLIGKPIPLYANADTLGEVERRFGYTLTPAVPGRPLYRPALVPHQITGRFAAAGMPVDPFTQSHGYSTTLGFRIGALAYSTDVAELDEDAFAALAGIELWIIDCLRREPHPTHSHLAKTLAWIERVGPRRAILTHMDQSLDYRELSAELPAGVEPGYDGLTIELPDPEPVQGINFP
jgi:phosphoribosyl 1,2-cyclic phosphate phosphodiesterase